MSVRITAAANFDVALLRFNGSSSSYSGTWVAGNGSAASSGSLTAGTYQYSFSVNAANATADTFSNQEIYIPNYTVSQNKASGSFGASENNATSAQIGAIASLWSDTSAITSIGIFSTNLVAGSSFYLYGIKNS
jgi:hypothetical protein